MNYQLSERRKLLNLKNRSEKNINVALILGLFFVLFKFCEVFLSKPGIENGPLLKTLIMLGLAAASIWVVYGSRNSFIRLMRYRYFMFFLILSFIPGIYEAASYNLAIYLQVYLPLPVSSEILKLTGTGFLQQI